MGVVDDVKKIIKESNNIVFFGGAGVSTASGIPDFRSATGLYNKKTFSEYSVEYMLSHDFLVNHPDKFSSFYKEELMFDDARPNKVHTSLYELEKQGKLRAIITQNVDGLHQMAGSTNVLELHGNLKDHYCVECGAKYDLAFAKTFKHDAKCTKCGGFVRPDVVLYGEQLNAKVMNQSLQYIMNADTLIVAGTSLVVYPAASFVQYYKGKKLIIINKEKTQSDYYANYVIHDDLSKTMETIIS